MSEEDKKQANKQDGAVVAEVVVQAEDTEQGAPAEAVAEQQAGAPRHGGRGLGLLALLVALAAGGASYVVWTQLEQQRSEAQRERQALASRLEGMATAQQTLATHTDAANAMLEQLQADGQTLSDALAEINARLGREHQGWVLAEAEYLLGLANRRLQLERDLAGAEAAMSAADQRLATLNDPLLTRTRSYISEELQALRAVPRLDVDGMVLELGALSKGIDKMVLAGTPHEEPQASADEAPVGGVRGFLRAVWTDIKSLVIIRRHDSGSLPLTTPDQRLLLRQNLRLKLETARLSLLRNHAPAYRAALSEADEWVTRFYAADHEATSSMHAALLRLGAIDVAPELPSTEQSLQALREAIQRVNKKAAPASRAKSERSARP